MEPEVSYIGTIEPKPGSFQLVGREISSSDPTQGKIITKDVSGNVRQIIDSAYILSNRVNTVNKQIRAFELERAQKEKIEITKQQLAKIDFTALDKASKDEFYNPSYFLYIKSIIETIVGEANGHEDTIRIWLNHISVISAGSFGRTLRTGIDEVDDLFAIKYSLDPKISLEHEYLVGLLLNKLRDENKTPNFMYTYTMFNCSSSPIIPRIIAQQLDSSEAPAFCGKNGRIVDYLVLENISNATTFGNFILEDGLTLEKFMSVFLQCFLSSEIASRELGATHWDYHTENILVKRTPKHLNKWIKYDVFPQASGGDLQSISIRNSGLTPFIVDYGFASIQGSSGITLSADTTSQPPTFFQGKPFFAFDIFRLLAACFIKLFFTKKYPLLLSIIQSMLRVLLNGNPEALKIVDSPAQYPQESLISLIRTVRIDPLYYQVLPEIIYNEFINIILKQGPVNYIRVGGTIDLDLLSCDDFKCETVLDLSRSKSSNIKNPTRLCYSGTSYTILSPAEKIILMNEINNTVTNLEQMLMRARTVVREFDAAGIIKELSRGPATLNTERYNYYTIESYYYSLLSIWYGFERLIDLVNVNRCSHVPNEASENLIKYFNTYYPIFTQRVQEAKIVKENLLLHATGIPLQVTPQFSIFLQQWDFIMYILQLPLKL